MLFVHGCFWHGHSCAKGRLPASNAAFWATKIAANKTRDRRVSRQLRAAGWHVMTVWACALRNEAQLLRRLKTMLSR